MTLTPCSQQKNVTFTLDKQVRNRIKYIKRGSEKGICSNCSDCKQAILLPKGVYCGKMRYQSGDMPECSFFDPEPIEYKLFRRT